MKSNWEFRLGVLIPSGNAVFERDCHRVLPEGVTAHFSRMKLSEDSPEQLERLAQLVPDATDLLSDAGISAIGFACTTGSLLGGLGYDVAIADTIEAKANVPATTTATAVVEAMRELRMDNVVVVSPYEAWLNEKVSRFLEACGIRVVSEFGFGVPKPRDIEAVSPEEIAEAVRRIDSDEANGVFISCTGFRGMEAAALLADLGKPVVTSNHATLWKLLGLAGSTHNYPWFAGLPA